MIGASLTTLVVLGEHDHRTIKTLIAKIETGLDEIKARSISSLHTKLRSGIVNTQQLCMFEELPGACLNWINDHPAKSQLLLKVLSILHEVSKQQRGCELLSQYEALEFFEEFRKHLTVKETNVDEYLVLIDPMIRSLLPLASKSAKPVDKQLENDPGQSHSRIDRSSDIFEDQLPKQIDTISKPPQPAAPLRFSEAIPRTELEEALERQIFDLVVQLKYGNKKIQFETVRMIKDFISAYPADSFRNRTELLSELGKCIEDGVYPNECSEIMAIILRGLIKQEKNYAGWELKPLTFGKSKTQLQQPTTKFQFPIKHSVMNSPYCQPLMESISSHFRKEWFDWLCHLQAEWCSDYAIQCLKSLPTEFLKERKPALLKLVPILLKSSKVESEWEWIGSLGLLEAKQFQERQEVNSMRAAFSKIKTYDHRLGQFLPHRHLHNFPKLLSNLQEGVLGLSYCPQIISVYLQTLLYLSIASFKQEPLKEFYEPHLKTFLSIAEHPSRKVRVKLYELLLEKAYLESNIEYLSDEFTASELTLSLLTDERILLKLFSSSLDQPESTVFMLELSKLLYLHHSRQVHHLFVRFVPLLNVLSQLPDQKISKIARQITDKFNSKELLALHIMNMFSKDRNIREDACKKLLEGANYSSVLSMLEDITAESKRNLKLKPMIVDEDFLINCMNIAVDTKLEPSVRASAINQLVQMVERADSIPNVAINRLQCTNDTLLSEAVKLDVNHPMLPHILAVNVAFVQLPLYCRLFDNKELMLVWLRNGAGIHTEYRILTLLYLNSFKNPFSDRLSEDCISQHWTTCSEKFLHVVDIPRKVHRLSTNFDIEEEEQASEKEQPTVSKLTDVDSLLRFVYINILHRQQPFKIPFDEVSMLIGSALSPNSPDYSLSHLRTLFQLYDQKTDQFEALAEEFMGHSVPSLLNIINREGNSHYFNMDALRIMLVAGVGNLFPKGIQQHNNARYMQILNANQDITVKLELFCAATVLPGPLVETMLKVLPTSDTPTLLRLYRKIIIRSGEVKKLIEAKDYARLALLSSLIRSLQQPKQELKILALQILLDILEKQLLDEHPSVFNLSMEILLEQKDSALTIIGALKLMRRILTIEPQYELDRLQKIGLPSILIDWLNDEGLPYMCYEATLNLLNSLIGGPMLRKYDLVELLVRLFYRVSRHLSHKSVSTSEILSLLSEICCSLLLLRGSDEVLSERLLSSTNLLETVLTVLEGLEAAWTDLSKLNVSKAEHGKVLNRFAQVIHMLTLHEDLFVFHLNKLINKSLEEGAQAKNVIGYLSKFLSVGDVNYHRMISRVITIWHKGHPSLDRDGLGGILYDQLKKSGEISLTYNLLAVSNVAKERFVTSGDMDKFITKALLVVDGTFVEDLKESKQPKKKEDVSASRISVKKDKPQNDTMDIRQILLLLKSFFRDCPHSSCQIKLPSANLVALIEKLFQVTSTKKRQQDFTDFKKAICNLSCNNSLAKDVFGCLLNSKSQFISELITVCARSDEQFNNVFKQSLEVLTLFVVHAEIRALVYRSRLLHDFSAKIQRMLDFKVNPNLLHQPAKVRYLDEVVKFMLAMSAHKDSHTKLVTDKHLFDELVTVSQSQDLEFRQLSTHTLMLLANLSYSKHNKTLFVSNKQLHRAIMTTLTAAKAYQEHKKYMLKLLYNLLYKSAAAIKIYKRKEVLTQLQLLSPSFAKQPEQKETLEMVMQILSSDYS